MNCCAMPTRTKQNITYNEAKENLKKTPKNTRQQYKECIHATFSILTTFQLNKPKQKRKTHTFPNKSSFILESNCRITDHSLASQL